MTQPTIHRYTITMPESLAKLVEEVCIEEGRNRSELFREAFRYYLNRSGGGRMSGSEQKQNDPFRLFWPDGASQSEQVYNRLAVEGEKDRLLEQWAQIVETAPDFEDVRAVSGAVDAVAGESIT